MSELLRGWVLDIGATPRVVAHFTARDPEMFARVAHSYRRGYAEDSFVVVSEVDEAPNPDAIQPRLDSPSRGRSV